MIKKRELKKVRSRLTKVKKFRFFTFERKRQAKRAVATLQSIIITREALSLLHVIQSTKTITPEQKIKKALTIADTVIKTQVAINNTFKRINQ